MRKIIDQIPKFLLGPLLVIVGIVYFYFQDPPKTVCDIQFEIFKQETEKYLYGYTKKKITIPAAYLKDIQACRDTNSVGGCYDWSEGIKKVLKSSRALPEQCRDRLSELDPLLKYYSSSLRIYSQISWNDTDVVRMRLFHWLDRGDILLFCRLKSEYIRLVGLPGYKALELGLLNELITLKQMSREQTWKRTVLSHNCDEG